MVPVIIGMDMMQPEEAGVSKAIISNETGEVVSMVTKIQRHMLKLWYITACPLGGCQSCLWHCC